MINIWRGWLSYMLLIAIVFKSLALGTLLTLSIHGMCLDGMANADLFIQKIATDHRKRNEEPSFNHTVRFSKAIVSERIVSKAIHFFSLKAPVLHAFFFNFIWKAKDAVYLITKYIPERRFIQNCSLLR